MIKDYDGPNLEQIQDENPEIYSKAKKFDSDGYVIVNLKNFKSCNLKIIEDINSIVSEDKFKKNPNYYHYNESPRIIEAWKKSESIKSLALNDEILSMLEIFYQAKPIPFSTINFLRGTEQPLHSDYIHFGSNPELFLVGVWVALEDISIDSGPLSVVKGSHKTPIVSYQDLGFKSIPKTTKKIKEMYSAYEEYLKSYIKQSKLEVKTPLLKAGDALFWQANLFHGAGRINNKSLTRYSQVTHYHFEGCKSFYNPSFSNRNENKFVERDVMASIIT